ncbi:MAG: twin-arginine translocase subunit TatC [Endomicrobia bacterium]|nr:twin-arginine translocase subunit TatC [Endomicrobiia bacterium]
MKMSVTDHLEELRWRLIRSGIYVIAASLVALFFTEQILAIIKYPSKGIIESFLILKPTESIAIYIKTAFFAGLAVAALPIFYEFFSFIKPAAQEHNSSVTKWVFSAFLLFVSGVLFSYFFVIPQAVGFLMNLSQGLTGTPAQITLTSYVSFVCALVFCGGMIFQIPLIAYIFTKFGLITPSLLAGKRKEAYFALCVIAAVITPTTDAFSMMLFVVPMIILYEIGVFISKAVYKKRIAPGGEVYEQKN